LGILVNTEPKDGTINEQVKTIQELPDDKREWSSAFMSDRLYLEMCNTNKQAVIYEGTNKEQKINWYYAEGAKYARRVSAGNFEGKNARYKPVFHLDSKDLSPELRDNLVERLKTSKDS
jgi:hypothetical protein